MKRRALILLVALVTRIETAKADESTLTMPISTAGEPSSTEFNGTLKMEGTQYVTPTDSNPRLNQSQSVIGNFHFEKKKDTRVVFDLVAGDNVTVGAPHFGISQAYFGKTYQSNGDEGTPQAQGYAVGRKLEYWSLVDSDWQLGQWQPTYGELDVLRPVDQGLTGVFFKASNGNNELLLFATPMFIPSMGPEVKEKNGSIESDSRWYKTPSPSFNWQGVVTQVVYSVDVPDIAKLVAKPGLGARYRWGDSKGPWVSANYGHKPINSLLLKYKTILRTPQVGSRGEVTVAPSVGYHDIGGIDTGYKFDSAMVGVSFLADQPSEIQAEDNWFQQQPEPFQAVGLHGDTDVDLPGLSEPLGLSLNYLRVTGGKIHDVDSTNANMGALFENRFNFTNAASVKVETRSQIFRKRVVSSLKYLREFDQKGSLLSGEMSVFPAKSWAVSVGVDILGVDNEINQDGTFLNQFRANDRYYGGLSYVF